MAPNKALYEKLMLRFCVDKDVFLWFPYPHTKTAGCKLFDSRQTEIISHTTLIGKAVVGTIGGQDDMIQHLNIKKLGGVLYLFGNVLVVGTWL